MRKYVTRAAVVAASVAGLLWVAAGTGTATGGQERQYVVLYTQGGSAEAAHAAIAAAGGTVLDENTAIGVATVTTKSEAFPAAARGSSAIAGVARSTVIGRAPDDRLADGKASFKRDAAQADLQGATAGRQRARTRTRRSRSRWPGCNGTCSRSAPPPTAHSATSRARACASASSTPASTAPIPTSPRTSTRR